MILWRSSFRGYRRLYAWIYFFACILVSTFTVLNLFIAVIVDAMQSDTGDAVKDDLASDRRMEAELALVKEELRAIRATLKEGAR